MGVFIERTARTSLGRYFEENIFKPLGIQSSAMVLSDAMRSNLSSMHTRDSAGKLKVRDHLNKVSNASNHKTDCFHSGGAGLFSTATDYCSKLELIVQLLRKR